MKKIASQQLSILHFMTTTCLIFNFTIYLPQFYCFCGQAECTNRINTDRISTMGLAKLQLCSFALSIPSAGFSSVYLFVAKSSLRA